MLSKETTGSPLVSVILLDWSTRDHLQALRWLQKQDVPRTSYELIWVELFDTVPAAVADCADLIIRCGQTGSYEKHKGYNAGLLAAKGKVITICDSDALFPEDFIGSIIKAFGMTAGNGYEPASLSLMHYQRRTRALYPGDEALVSLQELDRYEWLELWPDVGACASVRRADAIRFGGFDEHPSYRGYYCGPYELTWRLMNAGIPEIWHDESVCLYHFSHPTPASTWESSVSLGLYLSEVRYPHIKGHALYAVEALSTQRIEPLRENPEIRNLRRNLVRIPTDLERELAEALPSGLGVCTRTAYFAGFFLECGVKTGRALLTRLGVARLYRIVKRSRLWPPHQPGRTLGH